MQRMPFDVVLMSSRCRQRLAIVRLQLLVDMSLLILTTAARFDWADGWN